VAIRVIGEVYLSSAHSLAKQLRLIAKCQTCHIFCPYIDLKNPSSAQKGSPWGKIKKRDCSCPYFCVNAPRAQKTNFLSSRPGQTGESPRIDGLLQSNLDPTLDRIHGIDMIEI
jgi:hypothetical protein